MKKNQKQNPYATLGIGKVTAPNNTAKDSPKSTKSQSGSDMRGGKR